MHPARRAPLRIRDTRSTNTTSSAKPSASPTRQWPPRNPAQQLTSTTDTAAIQRLTDILLDQHTLVGEDLAKSRNLLILNRLADLVLTVGLYQLVCNFLNTFHVMPEATGQ